MLASSDRNYYASVTGTASARGRRPTYLSAAARPSAAPASSHHAKRRPDALKTRSTAYALRKAAKLFKPSVRK